MQFLPKVVPNGLLDHRHARLSANHDNLVNVADLKRRGLHRTLGDAHGAVDELLHKFFKFRPRKFQHKMLRSVRVGSDERKVDFALKSGRELDFRFFRRLI